MFASIEEKRQHYVDAKVYQCKRCGECMTSEQDWLKNIPVLGKSILNFNIQFYFNADFHLSHWRVIL